MIDSDLIYSIRHGELEAIATLYDKYSPLLYTLIKKITDNKDLAESTLQQVFEIIWNKIGLFNFNAPSIYTWIINLAKNKALDNLKRAQGKITEDYNDEYENYYILPFISPMVTIQDYEYAISNASNTEEAINNLTEAQKMTLYLAYFKGSSIDDIARQLNIPILTVKNKIETILDNLMVNFYGNTNKAKEEES